MTTWITATAKKADGSIRETPVSVLRRMVDATCFPGVIPWSCPVPSFGDYERARIASVGLNPSSREFLDRRGRELAGSERRFHTLGSLGLSRWVDATNGQLTSAWERCQTYFAHRPYDRWFRQLEHLVGETGASYYSPGMAPACHLDVIPYATWRKWGELSSTQRGGLLRRCRALLGTLIKNSPIEVLILNGRSVVSFIEELSGVALGRSVVPTWCLRSGRRQVEGVAFRGLVSQLGGVPLDRRVLVLGYNHNVQSSFGVTREVRLAMKRWIGHAVRKMKA